MSHHFYFGPLLILFVFGVLIWHINNPKRDTPSRDREESDE